MKMCSSFIIYFLSIPAADNCTKCSRPDSVES